MECLKYGRETFYTIDEREKNHWLRGGCWSTGAHAGAFITEHRYIGEAFTKEAQDAMRENITTAVIRHEKARHVADMRGGNEDAKET